MCRSIKVLRRPDTPVTPDEISAAALQFVRKVSGSHKPSKINQAAFESAVQEIAAATDRLLNIWTLCAVSQNHRNRPRPGIFCQASGRFPTQSSRYFGIRRASSNDG